MILFSKDFVQPILSGTKTVTRRMRWQWKCGSYQQCRVNYQTDPFAYVKIFKVTREMLYEMTNLDFIREGFKDREDYMDTHRSFFPNYCGELIRYEFETVTKLEYERKARFTYPVKGDTVKMIVDGCGRIGMNNLQYRTWEDTGTAIQYRVASDVITLMQGVKVVYLDCVRGYHDITKLEIVPVASQDCLLGHLPVKDTNNNHKEQS